MTPSLTPAQRLTALQNGFKGFYPDYPLTGDVSTKTQSKLIYDLRQCIPLEQFYFVVDMPNFEVRHIGGVYAWLKYLKGEFSMTTYIGALHPMLIDHQIDHARVSTARYARGEEKLEFASPLFSVIQAIQHGQSGIYLLVKRLVLPFQFSGNRLMSYLSHFTILGEYKNENLQFHYPDYQSDTALGFTREIKNNFWAKIKLSPGVKRLLEILVEYPNLTAQEIHTQWKVKISKRTIEKYCREILEYGKAQFPTADFKSAKDVARYIAKEYGGSSS